MDLTALSTVVAGILGGALIKVIDHVSSKRVNRELLKDEGENGDATIKRTLREVQEDVRHVRRLGDQMGGRFDELDGKVDGLGVRVSKLELITGLRQKTR